MTIKNAFHQFIDEEWDRFCAAHKLRDTALADEAKPHGTKPYADTSESLFAPVVEQVDPLDEIMSQEPPVGQRIVRTPLSGDKVYLLDETAKTKKWLRNPEAVTKAGFALGTETRITDEEMSQYKLSL